VVFSTIQEDVMEFQITTNMGEVQFALRDMPKSAIKALDQAVTFAAKIAQGHVRQELPDHFKIRNGWVAQNIVLDQSLGPMTVAIGVKKGPPDGSKGAAFMERQEVGGDKAQGSKPEAVPIGPASGYAKNLVSQPFRGSDLMGRTLKTRWPSRLNRSFTIKTGNGRTLVVQTTGKKGHGRLKVAYILKRRVRIKARWNFRQRVTEIAQAYVPRLFAGYFSRAAGR
jgi:hypothetical protein